MSKLSSPRARNVIAWRIAKAAAALFGCALLAATAIFISQTLDRASNTAKENPTHLDSIHRDVIMRLQADMTAKSALAVPGQPTDPFSHSRMSTTPTPAPSEPAASPQQ